MRSSCGNHQLGNSALVDGELELSSIEENERYYLARVLRQRSRLAEARSMLDLIVVGDDGEATTSVSVDIELGFIALLEGDTVESQARLDSARDWWLISGDLSMFVESALLAARIARTKQDMAAAGAELDEAIMLALSNGWMIAAIELLLDRAEVHLELGQVQSATRRASEARGHSAVAECRYAWGIARASHILGEAYERRGDRQRAVHELEEAVEIRTRIADPRLQESIDALARIAPSED